MNSLRQKSIFFISASAAIILNVSSDRKEPIIFCFIALLLLALLVFFQDNDLLNAKHSLHYKPTYPALSLVICSGMGCNFYNSWLNSWRIDKISELIGLTDKNIVLFFSIIGTLAAVPSMTAVIYSFSNTVLEDIKKSEKSALIEKECISLKKSFIILSGIFFIGIIAIIRANFNYIDDMGRALEGYRGWNNFSRFTSNAISTLIHTDNYITDISPLTQIIAVLFLSLASIALLYVVYERVSFSIWELISVIPLGLNPYFMECISYKFDSPFMALSILAAIAPLLFKNAPTWEYMLGVIIGNIIVCTTYQAASGIFPMVVILLSLRMWFKEKPIHKNLQFILISIIGYGIGLIFFRQIIMIPADTYVSNELPPLNEIFPTIIANYKHYFSLLMSDNKKLWKWIICLIMLLFVFSGTRLSVRKKFPSSLMGIIACGIMLLFCFGLYPALAKPSFDPRAMYGFGVFLALLNISITERLQPAVLKLPAITLSWIFLVFSFTFGNALYVQKTYTDFRITQVISDLNDMDEFLGEEPVTVQIQGTIGYAPPVVRMNSKFGVLKRLVPITFKETWIWGLKGFYDYYGLKNIKRDSSVDLTSYDLPLLKDSMYHTIYSDGTNVLISLK